MFALEVLIVIYILVKRKVIWGIECEDGDRSQKIDFPGMILSMFSLLAIILGALLSSTYGWFRAKAAFSIFGLVFDEISITFVLFCTGIVLLALLAWWLVYAKKTNRPVLIDVTVFGSRLYDFVLLINFFVQICLMGTMFITSLYLQNVLRYNAFATGMTLMPLSITLFVTALVAVRLAQKLAARYVVAIGAVSIFCGALYMFISLGAGDMVTGVQMIPSMVLLGIGIGCTLSQTGNIALSDIDPKYSNQGSGMITTVNNFGSSMSTSMIGSIFTGSVGGGIASAFVARHPELFSGLSKEDIAAKMHAGFQKIKVMDVTLEDLTAEQLAAVKDTVVHGVDIAMRPIFIIIMCMAFLAAVVAVFLLKKKEAK